MKNEVITGNCLETMATMPDNSIDLIATDPPYFGVKGGGSKGCFEWWDRQWDNPTKFLEWIDKLAEQWQRILKPNGSLYCCASPKMSARVEVLLSQRFNVLNNIRWVKQAGWHQKANKEEARKFKEPWESIIFCEHFNADNAAKGEAGYQAKCDELRGFVFEPLRAYLDGERAKAGLSPNQVNVLCGYREKGGMAGRHWFNASQFCMPTKDKYTKLQTSFPDYFKRPYEELRQQYEELRQQYEELRRPFSVSPEVPYTDVWDFPTVQSYQGKHPCEKPLAMMEHIILASSKLDAVVLDCFCGSGNTLLAAKNNGRQFIGIDIDPHWVDVAKGRLGKNQDFVSANARADWLEQQTGSEVTQNKRQLDIWDALAS